MPCWRSTRVRISPTLFNVHINDILEYSIQKSIEADAYKYADDCTLDESVKEGAVSHMQVLNSMQKFADANKMTLNSKKTKDMWISFRDCIPEPPHLSIDSEMIETTSSFKLLGVWL